MKFDQEEIKKLFPSFWKSVKDHVTYKEHGNIVNVENVSHLSIDQIEERDFDGGYNFKCTSLNAQVYIPPCEKPMIVEFYLKVGVKLDENTSKPTEVIEGIKDNTLHISNLY